FRGVLRACAQSAQDGHGEVREGKDPLPFNAYRQLAGGELYPNGHEDGVFGHAFLVIIWNLMCRAKSVTTICLSHIEMRGDAIAIFFAQQKTDQTGDRPRDPRHIFANPFMPEICPFLALGLFLLAYPVGAVARKLFSGNDQSQRFSAFLGRKTRAGGNFLEVYGIEPNDVGTHSARKGAATYAASGSTACPPIPAICLRAGWSVGPVQDRYIRYEAAGDQYVGRTVCGLPLSTDAFGVLPPYFCKVDGNGIPIPGVAERVAQAVSDCFGADLMPRLKPVAEFLLASVVYHREFLSRTLHPSHPVWGNFLFVTGLAEDLAPHVVLRYDGETTELRASGIPPHVAILKSLRTVLTAALADRLSEDVQRGFQQAMDANAIASGHITAHQLQEALKTCL
ncbi:unnamed protein product, partial [Phaeothamnion confervicola]